MTPIFFWIGAVAIEPDDVYIACDRGIRLVVQVIPDSISDKTCANPTVWQAECLHQAKQAPAHLVST